MSQLKMYLKVMPSEYPGTLNGFTFRRYNKTDEDILAWAEICRVGLLGDAADKPHEIFDENFTSRDDFRPENLFFVMLNGKPVATICILVEADGTGRVHMVGALPECRGRGVGKFLMDIANACLYECGCHRAFLTTDEHRIPAVKSYLRAYFLPVLYEDDMEGRWIAWLTENGYKNVAAVDDEGNYIKTLCQSDAENKIKIGIFGARRGRGIAQAAVLSDKAYISAVCDCDESTYAGISVYCRNETKYFKDFDEFIESGLDAVVLSNYFHEHAEYAVKALEKGIHVLSETMPAVTMADCVAICRASEKSGAIYMLAENYAYFSTIDKLTDLYAGGTLGDVIYSEGEYVHPMSHEEYVHYTPATTHWRALMPSGYYLSHSLAPLMRVTNDVPVAVNARSIYSDTLRQEREGEPVKDVASIMLCTMSRGSLARITGWAKFGGHGNWYRFACAKGSAETVRGNEDKIRICYNSWDAPEGAETASVTQVEFPFDGDKAKMCGHAGGDYYVTLEFINCILEGRQPYFNAYRSCAMSAVAILGWRSSLHNGVEYKIPDFSDEEERKAYENDRLSPFPDKNGNVNYPCTKYDADKFDI